MLREWVLTLFQASHELAWLAQLAASCEFSIEEDDMTTYLFDKTDLRAMTSLAPVRRALSTSDLYPHHLETQPVCAAHH